MIMAERRHSMYSSTVIGWISASVNGLGIGIRDMWCAGWGMMRMASDIVMILVSVWNQDPGRRTKILIENFLCLLFLGTLRMTFLRVVIHGGVGAYGCM